MKIQTLELHPYEIPLINSQMRAGVLINIIDTKGNSGWGEIAPLPKWSRETLEEALEQLDLKLPAIIKREWTVETCFEKLARLRLLPAISFGLESALFSLLEPLSEYCVPTSALLMGSPKEILEQANSRHQEGFNSAKLKVGHLNFNEAQRLIHQLKDRFHLRIDVNRAWTTSESLKFFSEFPLDTFDYVEEPFQNPHDLAQFLHPLAIDESFPLDLSLKKLELLPRLKALIYKPTMQGGMLGCLPLLKWTKKRGIHLVLSSSFESDIGLANIASIGHRLSLTSPIGIGTYHHLNKYLSAKPFRFFDGFASIPSRLNVKIK